MVHVQKYRRRLSCTIGRDFCDHLLTTVFLTLHDRPFFT